MAEDDRRLLVKQSYPFKTNGSQQCESLRKKYALSEVSRVITSEGTVIKNMMDGSIQVGANSINKTCIRKERKLLKSIHYSKTCLKRPLTKKTKNWI